MSITESMVESAQKEWGDGIVAIGRAFSEDSDYTAAAAKHIDDLYAYDLSKVLFKPTKATEDQFRGNKERALSYFVATNDVCAEDKGFALQPWTAVRFENDQVLIHENTAVAMGNYFFTDTSGGETKVEYTFGYTLDGGKLRIHLHHSSLPFAG